MLGPITKILAEFVSRGERYRRIIFQHVGPSTLVRCRQFLEEAAFSLSFNQFFFCRSTATHITTDLKRKSKETNTVCHATCYDQVNIGTVGGWALSDDILRAPWFAFNRG
jgi:hypothetical protein